MTEHPMHALHLAAASACYGLASTNRGAGFDQWARDWTLLGDWHRAQAERWKEVA